MPEAYWFGMHAPERILLDLGFFQLYWYSILVVAGIASAAYLARIRYLRAGGSEQHFVDLVFYTIIGGLIGARLWHVFVFHWSYYSDHLSEIIRIWEGGIAIQGALLGGVIALFLTAFHKRIEVLSALDAMAIGVPLGQAIGRWGNFFNQELYGQPTTMPWGIFIAEQNRVAGFEAFTHFHPTFLYESILNGILFVLLWRWSRKHRVKGSVTALYFMGYGIIRFLVDFVRIDPMLMVGPLRSSQVVALCMILVAGAFWYYCSRRQSVAK